MGFHAQYDCTDIGARESNSVSAIRRLVFKWQDIDVLKSLHKALEPMADFTDTLSGDSYVTVSSIKPTLRFIENASTAEPDDTRLTASQPKFKKTLRNATQVTKLRPSRTRLLGWTLDTRPNTCVKRVAKMLLKISRGRY